LFVAGLSGLTGVTFLRKQKGHSSSPPTSTRMSTDTDSSSIRSALSGITDGGPATWLIIAGVLLFVIPEPITSVLGALVLLVGLVVWAVGSLL